MEETTLMVAAEQASKYSSSRVWTLDEYADAEEFSDEKHEFHNGKRTTMPGGTLPHNEICNNIGTVINIALFSKETDDVHVYNSDMKVYIPLINKSVYPDLTVIADKPILRRKDIIQNPTVLVEVLSKSTEDYDRGEKFKHYKTLPSFREYVLIDQYKASIDVFYLENPSNGTWSETHYEGLEAEIKLQSIDCTIKTKGIYRRIF